MLGMTVRRIVCGQDAERTVSEAAIRLKVKRPALSAVLNGYAGVSVALAVAIEDSFGFSAGALLHLQTDMQLNTYRRTIKFTSMIRSYDVQR